MAIYYIVQRFLNFLIHGPLMKNFFNCGPPVLRNSVVDSQHECRGSLEGRGPYFKNR